MKSIIVNINRETDLYERYNNEVSSNLIKYLMGEARTKDDVEIIVNTKLDVLDMDKLIRKGLEDVYNDTKKIDKFYDTKRIRFFIIGVMFLLISTFMGYEILRELVLIVGWFAIYEVIEIAFNIESKIRKRRKKIKKLINCEIKINKI